MFPEQQRITQQINHLMDVMVKSECEIRPHFFLTGPTGSGHYITHEGITYLQEKGLI